MKNFLLLAGLSALGTATAVFYSFFKNRHQHHAKRPEKNTFSYKPISIEGRAFHAMS